MHPAISEATPRAPALAPRHADAALQVLADGSLFQPIVSFAPGIPFFALRVKRQLKCLQSPPADTEEPSTFNDPPHEDVELWQNAVLSGDRRTLEALHVLSRADSVGELVQTMLRGILGFALTDLRDTALLDWIDANEMFAFAELERSDGFELGERGDLERIRWMHDHGYFLNYEVANGAASGGHLDVLQFILSVGKEEAEIGEDTVGSAAANGHLHVLEYLFQLSDWEFQGWGSHAFSEAIESGQLHVVQYLHENGYECGEYDIDDAARNGHLDVVKYLHENRIGDNAFRAVDDAVENGHLEVVKFLLSTGRKIFKYTIIEDVVKNNHFDMFKVLHDSGVDGAVSYALRLAVEHRNMKFAKFLYELDPKACADEGGYLTANAAERGYLEFIEFFHESGDPEFFDSRAMCGAAVNGHLDIVKFLHENRDEDCTVSMVRTHEDGHHHVVDYLCENRPMKRAKYHADSARRMGYPDLADKIERGATAATAADRKLYYYK